MGGHEGQDLYGLAGKHIKKLIEAVVECAYGEGTPPPELKIGWQCERWHCLPEQGAYLDQDYKLMYSITALSNIYNTVQRWRNSSGKSIHSLTDGERRILRMLKDMGVIFN